MPVDWKTLTPQEVWDALRAAPKVAGPWCRSPRPALSGVTYEWRDASPVGVAAWVGPDDRNYDDDDPVCIGYFASREEADEALLLNGWLLV